MGEGEKKGEDDVEGDIEEGDTQDHQKATKLQGEGPALLGPRLWSMQSIVTTSIL